jgi:hypothetical protein
VIPFYLQSVRVHSANCIKPIKCHVGECSVELFCKRNVVKRGTNFSNFRCKNSLYSVLRGNCTKMELVQWLSISLTSQHRHSSHRTAEKRNYYKLQSLLIVSSNKVTGLRTSDEDPKALLIVPSMVFKITNDFGSRGIIEC